MTAAATHPPLITETGIHPGMDEQTYHNDPVAGGSLSSGGARKLLEPGGPARFAYERRHPRARSTKAFDLGHCAHTLALGAGAGIERLAFKDLRTKAAQQAQQQAYADGKVPILEGDYQRVMAMVDAIRSHELAGPLLAAYGPVEQSIFWIDQPTGIWRRARPDKTIRDRTGRLVLIDLKTCENADEVAVAKSTARYGYHQQDPWYRDAAIALGLDDDPGFIFIYVEKQPPHLVHVVQLDPDDVAAGRRRNRRAIDIYAECTATGAWPGHPTDITQISLPAWATREDDL